MGRIPWDTKEPGHFEVDLVQHSGPHASGEFGHTLQLIDVATGWSERVMLLGRGQLAMEAAFRQVLHRLPFPVVELHPDNASRVLQRPPRAVLERESERRATLAEPTVSEE